MRRRLSALGIARVFMIAVALLWSGAAQAAELSSTVKYVSAEHIYVDSGSSKGLAVGLVGRVVRDGKAIGELEIVFVAEQSASCTVSSQLQEILAGDTVIFEVAAEVPEVVIAPAPVRQRTRATGNTGSDSRGKAKPRLRGSIALQWDHGEETNDRNLQTDVFRLPFRLQARDVWRGFDFRTRGSLRQLNRKGFSGNTPSSEWRNRIQEVAFVRDDRELDWHVAFGRIGGRVTNTAGPFDGLAVNRRVGAGTRVGLFGGFAPEWGNLGFGTDDHLLGANFHFNRRAENGRILDFVLAGIGRYRSNEISREYVTMNTTWRGSQGLSLLQAAEIDFNRGWRQEAGARSVVLSSFAFTGRYQFNRQLSADLGYDNREPVRTWETRSLPDSLFENAGRKGLRAGVRLRPTGRMTLNLSGSLRKDDRTDDDITSWNARVNAPGFLAKRVVLYGGLRGFSGPWLSGWAPSLGLSGSLRSGYQLRADGGYYSYTGKIDDSSRDNTWVSLGVSKDLNDKLSALVEYRRDWGDDIVGQRWFLELRRRF